MRALLPDTGRKRMNRSDQVRRHFDKNVYDYTEKHLGNYRTICERRLDEIAVFFSPGEELRVLDVGCGASTFSDLLMTRFPKATVVCLDFSLPMLTASRTSPRKQLVAADCTQLPFQKRVFDLVNVDTLMHHLVSQEGYNRTIQRIAGFLAQVDQVVRPGGLIAVREIYHESPLIPTLHSRLIYELSIRQVPQLLARVIRWAGLSTINVGICFLSRKQWQNILSSLKPSALRMQEHPWKHHKIWYYRAFGFRANGDYHCYLSTSTGIAPSPLEGMKSGIQVRRTIAEAHNA